ncbi:MAG TPA: hypothetical protein VFH74_13410 [Gaiellales bacterium]|nr:hypothetical protein [Gaiellales bacterium]
MSKLEDRPGELIHDPGETTERRRPTPLEREVLSLLGIGAGQQWVRLSISAWDRVERVAAALHDARSHNPVPMPRHSLEESA